MNLEHREACPYCGRTAGNRLFLCMNTRDMEDWAVAGDETCYARLAERGGGERGMERVDMLISERRLSHGDSLPPMGP